MPRTKKGTPPSNRRHSSGQAIVTLPDGFGGRKDFLLGPHSTRVSREEYARVLAEWEANGRRLPKPAAPTDLSVNELLIAYWRFAETYYVKDGAPTSEQDAIRSALRYVKKLYGLTPAKDFGPLALKAVREAMVKHPITNTVKDRETGKKKEVVARVGLSRGVINKHVDRIRRVFAWAVENALLPVTVHQALTTVQGLRKGRSEARESRPVKPVADALVDATLPHIPPTVQAMIQVQRLTGMRPQEVVLLRPLDIDMSGPVWEYRPARHKTEHHERDRIVFIGPRAQALLRPYLPLNVADFFFCPRRAEEQRSAKRRQERKSPMTPSQARRKPKANRRRAPRDRYDVPGYRRAIRRGCVKAGLTVWKPNELRHARGTDIRRRYGLEAAQAVLGHAELGVTQVYAEADLAAARKVMQEVG
jgi:integrase